MIERIDECRLGFIVDFLSHAAIVGFMGGAATVVCLQQLKAIFGLQHFTRESDVVSVLRSVFTQTSQVIHFLLILRHILFFQINKSYFLTNAVEVGNRCLGILLSFLPLPRKILRKYSYLTHTLINYNVFIIT